MDISNLSQQTKSRSTIPLIAALWATVVALYLFFASTYDRSVVFFGPNSSAFKVARNEVIDYGSEVAVNGPRALFGLTIPILLALSPLAVRKHRRGALLAAGALTVGVCLLWPFCR